MRTTAPSWQAALALVLSALGIKRRIRPPGAHAVAARQPRVRDAADPVDHGPFEVIVLVPSVIKDVAGSGPEEHALILAAFGIGGMSGRWSWRR